MCLQLELEQEKKHGHGVCRDTLIIENNLQRGGSDLKYTQ
jgi:hypothetical protein